MKIAVENTEALRSWLTKTLSPICDADPQALAKYVLALVKKEKEEDDLKYVCVEQLDVFLQEKTKEFVEVLFVALKDKSYIPPAPVVEEKPATPPPPPQPPTPPPPPEPPREPPREINYRKSPTKDADTHRDDKKVPFDDLRNKLSHKEESRRRSRSPYRERSPLRNRSPMRGRSPPGRRGGVFDRLDRRQFSPDRGRPRYGSRHSPDRKRRSPLPRSPLRRSPGRLTSRRSPGRSTSRRSPGRSPLRRSPGRSPIRRSPGRSPLRRSPGRSPLRRSPGRSPTRKSPGKSPLRRSPIRSPTRRSPLRRSPRGRSPLARGRSPPIRVKSRSPDSRVVKRSDSKTTRSVSQERKLRSRSRTPPMRRRFRPRSWSMSSSGLSDSFSRSRSRSPKAKKNSPDSRGSTPRDYSPYNRTTNTRDFPVKLQTGRVRCRDYDEKGFCMKGDLCQFDHGNDPVVVDDVNLPSVLQLNQNGPPPPPPLPNGPPPPMMHQRPPGPPRQPILGPPGGPPLPGQRPPMPPGPPHRPMGPRPPMMGRPPPPHPPPRQGPLIRPGFPGPALLHIKGATPPPPGTVPIRMPPQDFQQPPPSMAPVYAPEPYNPEAPALSAVNTQPAYVPTQIGPRQQVSAHQRLGPLTNPSLPSNGGKPAGQSSHLVSVPVEHRRVAFQGPPPQQGTVVVKTVEVGPSADSGNNARTVLLGKRENDDSSGFANGNTGEPAHKKPAFDKSRLGAKNFNSNNTLELRKIPREMNNIASLNQHFSKFGLITNLQISYNGDGEAAIVSFASPAQAKAAYRCTEPIFNNRFVRVFWHNPTDENVKPHLQDKKLPVKDRLGAIPPAHKLSLNNVQKTKPADQEKPIVKTPTGLTKTVFNPDALKKQHVPQRPVAAHSTKQPAQQQAALQLKTSLLQSKKQEVLKKKLEIQKKKQQLLYEQLKQQKVLIGKLEGNKNISAEDKNSILKTIKVLADSIEKLKHELLGPSQKKLSPAPPQPKPAVVKEPAKEPEKEPEKPAIPPKTPTTPDEQKKVLLQHKQQAQKAILDTELDIINKSYEGADTSELRQKVARLKEEAMSLGLLGRGRGVSPRGGIAPGFRGGRGGRGRGSYAISHILDRRPKQLVVMGFLLEEKEEVLKHLGGFGEIESVIGDDTVPSVNINFKTRQGAEMAAREGQAFKKKRLVMMWHKPEPGNTTQGSQDPLQTEDAVGDTTATIAAAEEEEEEDPLVVGPADDNELGVLDEATLLGLDEEEEGEEERSWKP